MVDVLEDVKVTRLPSQERPWLKWYKEGVREASFAPIERITMWGCLKRAFDEQGDKRPAFRYFGNTIKRSEVVENVEKWSKTFRGMGVQTDERVVVYSPTTPELLYILFALNNIGAWPVMLNMASSPEALARGAQGARFAVVADAVEANMAHVLRDTKTFEKVVFVRVSECMPILLRTILNVKDGRSFSKILKENSNYITTRDALRRWSSYDGPVSAEYDENRPAIITSSGGTSSQGYAKQIMDTNRAVISMIRQAYLSPMRDRYVDGGVCYMSLPPFVSTSVFVLLVAPLYTNMTCCLEPRLDAEIFAKDVMKFRPQITLIPGRCWISFFTGIERMVEKGKIPDLSFFTMPVVGGEGVLPSDLRWMNSLLKKCGSKYGMTSGYGLSEVFSMLTADTRPGFAADEDNKQVISVGMPMPGADVGIFDENDNELTYGQRGEVRCKTVTQMRGYYNDDELTRKVTRTGWFETGDLGMMDEDGMLYVYCRMSEGIKCADGSTFYPVDMELKMNDDEEVRATMVNNMSTPGKKPLLAVHLVLKHNCADPDEVIRRLDSSIRKMLPEGVEIGGYKIHRHIFRMSNVCKIDRNSYKAEMDGYFRPLGKTMQPVSFKE